MLHPRNFLCRAQWLMSFEGRNPGDDGAFGVPNRCWPSGSKHIRYVLPHWFLISDLHACICQSSSICFVLCFIVVRARFLALLLFPWAICLSAEPLFSIRLFIFGTQLTRVERLFSSLSILHKSHCVRYLIMCCWISHLCLFPLFEDMHCYRVVSHFAAINRLIWEEKQKGVNLPLIEHATLALMYCLIRSDSWFEFKWSQIKTKVAFPTSWC